MNNPSPGSCRGGSGRPGEAWVPTGEALIATIRRGPGGGASRGSAGAAGHPGPSARPVTGAGPADVLVPCRYMMSPVALRIRALLSTAHPLLRCRHFETGSRKACQQIASLTRPEIVRRSVHHSDLDARSAYRARRVDNRPVTRANGKVLDPEHQPDDAGRTRRTRPCSPSSVTAKNTPISTYPTPLGTLAAPVHRRRVPLSWMHPPTARLGEASHADRRRRRVDARAALESPDHGRARPAGPRPARGPEVIPHAWQRKGGGLLPAVPRRRARRVRLRISGWRGAVSDLVFGDVAAALREHGSARLMSTVAFAVLHGLPGDGCRGHAL